MKGQVNREEESGDFPLLTVQNSTALLCLFPLGVAWGLWEGGICPLPVSMATDPSSPTS